MHSKNIVAIGGGGFGRSLGSLEIEKYIVSLSNKKRPKICFIPTASGDSSLYKLNFYRAFSKLDCITSHIDFFSRTENLEEKVLTQDIIYVGGGNTKSMLAVWKEWNLNKILRNAYEKGIVMSGVSAGAICWFEKGITDSFAEELINYTITSDSQVNTLEGDLEAKGNVVIKSNSGNFEAYSDKLSFDKDDKSLKLIGNVYVKNLESEGIAIEETSGDELTIFTETGLFEFKSQNKNRVKTKIKF